MSRIDPSLMYDFHVEGLSNAEAVRRFSDHTVREIKIVMGEDADIQVRVEPEVKDKHLFAVSMGVFGLGDAIVIRKQGKHVLAAMRKARKAILRKVHKVNRKKLNARKKSIFREHFAS